MSFLTRKETIVRIRKALKERSGKTWSVTGGSGSAYGWIKISAPPARQVDFGMTESDCAELAQLLNKNWVHRQGENIPGASDFYQEYIDRAEGRIPSIIGVPYWD